MALKLDIRHEIDHPSMPIILDESKVKMCSVCRANTSLAVINASTRKEVNIGFEGVDLIRDMYKSIEGKMAAFAYICSKCGHLDFYTGTIPATEILP